MKSKVLTKVPVILLLAISTSVMSLPKNISEVVAVLESGEWGWVYKGEVGTCSHGPHSWKFDIPNKTATIRFDRIVEKWEGADIKPGKEATYSLVAWNENKITMKLHGENRKTKNGDLVVWELWILDGNRYTWHRTDWNENQHTAYIERCTR